jgi:hypothetical protein
MMMLSNKLPEGSRPPPQTMDNWLLLCGSARSPKNMLGLKSEIIWCLRIGQKGNVKKVFDKFDPYHPIVLGVNDFDIS